MVQRSISHSYKYAFLSEMSSLLRVKAPLASERYESY